MTTRREQQRIDTIAEIKETALQQMAAEGATSMSLRGIARQMGLSAPALYRYFPNYDALLTALIVDAYSSLADTVEAAEATQARDDFGGRLVTALQAYRGWALANRAQYLLIAGTPIPNYSAPQDKTEPQAQRTWRVVLSILAEAGAAGVNLLLPIETDRPLPHYEAYSALWSQQLGMTLTVPMLHAGMASAALMNGLFLAEVTERFPLVSAETTLLEIDALRARIGLPAPLN